MKCKNSLTTTILTTLLLPNIDWAEAPSVPGSPPHGSSDQNNLLVTTVPPTIQTLMNSQPNSPYIKDFERGLLNVEAYGATGDVFTDDDTTNLQQALYDAYEYQLVTYFPTGTYEVSNTLQCDQAVDNHRRYCFSLLGQKGNPVNNRPVIRLKSGLGSFGSPNSGPSNANPKPILRIWGRQYNGSEKAGDCFNNVVRGIDFNLSGYAGAAAIYFAGAQGCSVEDVTIDATGGYCGFIKTIGVNGGYYNVTVHAGRYAIYNRAQSVTDQFPISQDAVFTTRQNALFGQPDAAPATFVGFHIKKANGPVFESLSSFHEQGCGLTLMDGIIELTSATNKLVIDNDNNNQGRSIYIKDVYMKDAGTIIKNTQPTGTVSGTANGWTKVLEYGRSYTASASLISSGKKPGRNMINGVQISETPDITTTDIEINFLATSVPDPDTLIGNHVWDENNIPAFDDPGVWDAVTDGGLDNTWGSNVTTALNDMLRDHDKVFLPKGLYQIRGTIKIPGNTKFFGVSRRISVLRPKFNNWDPTNEQYIIETDDDAQASPYFSNVWLDFTRDPNEGGMVSLVHWQAGSGSMIRNTFAYDQKWVNGISNSGVVALNKKLYRFSGNAGGRIYGMANSWQNTSLSSGHDDFRVFYIEGTSEPLNFYGLNVERQLGTFQSEINNAQNVALFGLKTEGGNPKAGTGEKQIDRDAFRPTFGITNGCDNIIVATLASSQAACKKGWIHVVDSTNILGANLTSQAHHSAFNLVWEKIGSAPEQKINAGSYSTAHYQRGLTTLMDFSNPPNPDIIKFEFESLALVDSSGNGYTQNSSNASASGGALTWYGSSIPGDFATFEVNVPIQGEYRVYVGVAPSPASGIFQLKIDGENVGTPEDLYSSSYDFETRDLGIHLFPITGNKQFRFEITGTNGSNSVMRLDFIRLERIPNTTPTLSPIPATATVDEECIHVLRIEATDPNAHDTLSLSVEGLPSFATLTDNGDGTGVIVINPGPNTGGDYDNIIVSVDDGNTEFNTASASFDLTVVGLSDDGIYYNNDFSNPATIDNFASSNIGYFSISDGELSANDTSQYKTILFKTEHIPEITDNYKIVSRMKKGTASGYKGPAIRFRHLGSSNFNELQINSAATNNVRIAGPTSANTIATWDVNFDPEVYNTYSLVVNGTNVSVYVNNDFIGNATIANLTGKTGLTERADTAVWDYFRVITNGTPDYFEDFDDTLAQNWNYDPAKFQLSDTGGGNYAFKQSAGSSFNIASYNTAVSIDTHYSVAVEARVVGTRDKNWDSPNLVLKYIDADNFISTYVDQDTSSGARRIRVKKVIGGVTISDSLNTVTTALTTVSDWNKYHARISGDKLSIFINDEEAVSNHVITELNAAVFNGTTQCGVRSPTSSVSAEFDNFEFFDEYSQP